ncbi:PREDICTED: ninja-family protein AFP1-like, partial [Tarenaya hassleriana]|uniref:ninja-family protein AFP1-like n=1 Tax=Tarenaya hassleriana TaxID=28532 RepID=UPI00053C7328
GGSGGGGSSSSLSELESRPPQASSNCSEEARTVTPTTQGANTSNRLRRLSSVDMNMQGKGKNEMPCVFTKGEGPNGRRVDGILYRYGKGSEVRIMCVCHGTFLSPAEFVKHAGGGDVDHPLRHIVVNTASSSVM